MYNVDNDKKMELFLDTDIWKSVIDSATTKSIDIYLVTLLTKPEYRVGLAEAIVRGDYHFGISKYVEIPKDNGKMRGIYVNSNLDRIVFAVITKVFYKLYGDCINNHVLAYRECWSTAKAVRDFLSRVDGSLCGYKSDYSKYFDTVPRWLLLSILKKFDTGSPIDKILLEFYTTDLIEVKGEVIPRYKSLCQGSSFSAFLANVCLKELDDEASKLCQSYTRYSDDIVVFGKGAEEAMQYIKEKSNALGLTLNPDKVQYVSEGQPFTFLGAKICGDKIDLGQHSINTYKAEIRKIISDCFSNKKNRYTRIAQQKAIRNIKKWVFACECDDVSHCWFTHAAGLVNVPDSLVQLDKWTKERIRAMYTGGNNYTTNVHKTPDDVLENLGWVSLNHMYKLFKISRDVYYAEVRRIEFELAGAQSAKQMSNPCIQKLDIFKE